MSNTIAVLTEAFSLSEGELAGIQIFGDQPKDRFATNKARKVATITAKTFPELLRQMADFWEQQNCRDLDDLARWVKQAHEEARKIKA